MSLLVVAIVMIVAAPAQAAAKGVDGFFGGTGTGTGGGQFNEPRGVAVNEAVAGGAAPGDIYVVDGGNNRVQRFRLDGASSSSACGA